MARYKYTTCKQEGGDDGYCYVIRHKQKGYVIIDGLTRAETSYYRDKIEKELAQSETETHPHLKRK